MYKIGLLFSDISEIHAVLAVLCEIDKATSLHACSAGCGRTGSKRANINILNVDIDSWYRPISTICDSENWLGRFFLAVVYMYVHVGQ